MDDPEKRAARKWMMDKLPEMVSPSIITLPARAGNCAKEFRKKFPKPKIIGIDRNERIVRTSTLTHDKVLDMFFHTSDANMLKETFFVYQRDARRDGRIRMRAGQQFSPASFSKFVGKFQILFLDYTSKLPPCDHAKKPEDVEKFLEYYADAGAHVFMTFTRQKKDEPPFFDTNVLRQFGIVNHYEYGEFTDGSPRAMIGYRRF